MASNSTSTIGFSQRKHMYNQTIVGFFSNFRKLCYLFKTLEKHKRKDCSGQYLCPKNLNIKHL